MADQRKVELILGIRTEGAVDASNGLDSISQAAGALNDNLSQLQRKDALKELGQVAAQVAAQTGDLQGAANRLATELTQVGASEQDIRLVSKAFEQTTAAIEKADAAQAKLNERMARDAEKTQAAQEKLGAAMAADIEKSRAAAEKLGEAEAFAAAKAREAANGASQLQGELGKISRADQIRQLGTDMGALAKKTGDVASAAGELDKKLKALGADSKEIQSAAQAFSGAQNAPDATGGSNGPGGNLLQRAGTGLRNLPSIQIPGAGIGTDAIGNITRLTGALGEAAGVTGAMTAATTALTPALGASAAGVAGVLAVAGPLILIVGALGIALKGLGDQAAAESKAINAIVDAQRDIAQQIAEGLTTEDAKKQLDDLNAKRQAEADLLAKNQQVYDENIENQGALTGVLKLTSGAEQALTEQIDKSKETVSGYDTQIQALEQAMQNGTLAANDAKLAEEELAQARTQATLESADNAGKELAAQQKALGATEEQNKKRLETIDDEKAVLQRQIDVLTESGDTSEEVTKKIANLQNQLGLLGKESDFISDTALEVSRQRDAEKKAQKDAEDAAKKAQQAQEQYTKAVTSATTTYKNAVQDIGTRLTNTLSDNTLKFNRDLVSLTIKHNQDEFDLQLKANRAERDAAQAQFDDLSKLRQDADKEEQAALRDGDFKALFLARQKSEEAQKEEKVAVDKAKRKRDQDLADGQQDLLRAFERQRETRRTGYDQQNMDARTAQHRELAQATLTRQRALQVASEGQAAELKQLGAYYQQRLKMDAAYQQQALKMNGPSMAGPNMPANTPQSFSFGGISQVIRK